MQLLHYDFSTLCVELIHCFLAVIYFLHFFLSLANLLCPHCSSYLRISQPDAVLTLSRPHVLELKDLSGK